METQIVEIDLFDGPEEAAQVAAEELRAGGVVALPTETVYGLAGDATDSAAVAKIFAAKERPAHDPLIVHVRGAGDLQGIAEVPEDVAEGFRKLVEAFWPGPLTVVLPRGEKIPDEVTSGLPTVAVRVSDSPVVKAVLRAFGGALAAPSANRFGRISPTTCSAVVEELGGRIPLIIDAGACREGVESTIVRLRPRPKKPFIDVLRAGPVTKEMLRPFGKVTVLDRTVENGTGAVAEVPGQMDSHYAPATPLVVPESPEAFQPEEGKKYALLSYRGEEKDGFVGRHAWERVEVLSPGSGKMSEAAVRFYAVLRRLDALGVDVIVAEPMPTHGLGLALNDRLRRASR